ncbi:hypothetical protein FOY66_01345 [Mycoplasma capricolum subsp. capripneumoniae]|uniref:Uncharacterized protein n=1 Tax=Mycoplasma capricolum subsp. capripneumoniae 87001 TaxID=1124992 RepID=A0A9N7AXV8_MYCCC|nr:hypothetical protein [Mycoplasma capricolum]AJK51284.1 hypothetical protein MCCG_0306 [Mycoplasma capricolum subsp. capripneumoniae 87001]AOQ21993.1 hypothetical protein M1601_01360 [Mycoplasma capricolum subsp. capripneumoniae M1601]KEY84258.1 hypothetical protein MCCP_7930 [Mycoplasma capricolum subsp. capripneumoniae 99108]QDL19476.1 hypothetical protein DQW15_01355 [Mycoplasma capricolum subsp. capripneumoniae]QDL20161.1 hypothetical protein DQW16_01355 [Mycoplasma capricolum subsp. cap
MNKKEVFDTDFFESGLAYILTNLDFIQEELEQENLQTNLLKKLISDFEDIQEYETWDTLTNNLIQAENQILEQILKIKDSTKFNLLNSYFLAKNLAIYLKSNSFLIEQLEKLKSNSFNDLSEDKKEEFFNNLKQEILKNNSELYKQNQKLFNDIFEKKVEFKKIYQLLIKENEFEDFNYANELLFNMLNNNSKFNDKQDLLKLEVLNNAQSLIDFLNFYESSLFDNEEE